MGCLGVLLSIDDEVVDKLRSFDDDEELVEYLFEELEETYFEKYPEWVAELDKSWDALHRCLTDGILNLDNGTYPLNHVILGGEQIYEDEDYIMSLKTPQQVKDVADALKNISKEHLKSAYFKMEAQSYGSPMSNEDFEYTWHWFTRSIDFWNRAAEQNRYVLFTADQ
jgi:hypothetical protein